MAKRIVEVIDPKKHADSSRELVANPRLLICTIGLREE